MIAERYSEWIAQNDTLAADDRNLIRSHISRLAAKPKFSILMPLSNDTAHHLRSAIDSVRAQLYECCELSIAADGEWSL